MNYKPLLTLLLLLLLGCQSEELTLPGLSLDSEDICLEAEGGHETLNLSSDGQWTATSTAPWLSISPANGVGSARLTLKVDSTLSHDLREAGIRFTSSTSEPVFLKVTQMGYGKAIVPKQDSIQLKYSDILSHRHFEVNVATNVPFKVEIEYDGGTRDWLTANEYEVTLDRGARPRTTTLHFDWKMNTEEVERKAHIRFVSAKSEDAPDVCSVVEVTQAAAPTITDDRQGDSLAVLMIQERMNCMTEVDPAENMMYWNNVELWEAHDSDLPSPEAVGRIRYAGFTLFNTLESVAPEVSHLRFVERLSFYGNYNTMLKSIDLGTEVCRLKHLRHLQIAAYGLVSLPDEFAQLGATLETLDLNSNNFEDIPEVINRENFPHLKSLNFSTCRRYLCNDLRNKGNYQNGIGLHLNFNTKPKNAIRRLFLWDTLEKLALSYNYLEGELPEFQVGEDGVKAWTMEDVKAWGGDTISRLVGRPKVLPVMKDLRINLNYFTGKLPEWILYHPHLLDWDAEAFIFTLQDKGITSSGTYCGFTNVPENFDYFYEFFPGYKEKYYIEAE